VNISKKGLQLLERLDQKNDQLDNLLKNLSRSEIEQLNNLLDKMREKE